MELATARAISNLPHLRNPNIIISSNQLRWRPSLPAIPPSISVAKQGLRSYKYLSLRLATSDESSSITSRYVKDETDSVISFEDRQSSEEKEYDQRMVNETPQDESASVITIKDSSRSDVKEYENTLKNEASQDEPASITTVEDSSQSEVKEYDEAVQDEAPAEDSRVDLEKKLIEFLDQLYLKFDSAEDSFSILLFGGTAAVALWLATAIVGAVDSIPVFPKLLEVVGLGYTVWFSYRYLIFKRNRDELAAKIEELKQQVLGLKDE